MNWTIFAFYDIITTIVMAVLCLIVISNYIRKKFRHLLVLSLLFLSTAIANLIFTLANLFLSNILLAIFIILMTIEVLFTCIFVDFVVREKIDPLKMTIWAFLAGMMIIKAFDYDTAFDTKLYANGAIQLIYKENGIVQHLFTIMSIFWGLLLIYLAIKIYFEIPKSWKSHSSIMLIAIIAIIIRGIWTYQFNEINPIINIVLLVIGFGALTFYFNRYPELFFVVPFKPLHFNVLTKAGLSLFSFNWRTSTDTPVINNTLFSGLCTALNMGLNKTVRQGNIKEVHLDKAILLLNRSLKSSLLFVIIVAKPSISVRKALISFTNQFDQRFSKEIKELNSGIMDISKFKNVEALLAEFFPF